MRALLIATMLAATASADTTPAGLRAGTSVAPKPCTPAYGPVEAAIKTYCRAHRSKDIQAECARLLVESRKYHCKYLHADWDGDVLDVFEALSDVWAFAHLRFVHGAWKVVAVE
jgi:hypothetical protein